MKSGWRGGSQGPAGAASSQPLMSRSTRCLAPNTPQKNTHQAPCLPSPLGPRVQDVHFTHPVHVPPFPPLPSAPDLNTPPSRRPHLYLMAAQLHSHAPPPRQPHPKKWRTSGRTAPTKLPHPPTRTVTGLGHTHQTRTPQLEQFHLPLSRQRLHTDQEPPQRTLPDTLTPRRAQYRTRLLRPIHVSTPCLNQTSQKNPVQQWCNANHTKLFTTTNHRTQMSWSSEKETLFK